MQWQLSHWLIYTSYTQTRAEKLNLVYCKFNFQILVTEDMSTISEIYLKCTVHEAFYKMLWKTL